MLKAIVSSPGLALASRIACRSDPAPESLVLVTVNVLPARVEALIENRMTIGIRRMASPLLDKTRRSSPGEITSSAVGSDPPPTPGR